MPVLPSLRRGIGGWSASCTFAWQLRLSDPAVASAPAWRNARRSVPFVWSWDIASTPRFGLRFATILGVDGSYRAHAQTARRILEEASSREEVARLFLG